MKGQVSWIERYSSFLEEIWKWVPDFLGTFIATVAIFLLGISVRGDWLLILVHFARYLRYGETETNNISMFGSDQHDTLLSQFKLQNLFSYVFYSNLLSFSMYFLMGGFIHWYFYIHQRDRPEEWKCQPKKWNTAEMDLEEMKYGTITLAMSSTFSAAVTCYSANGGTGTQLYYEIAEYGWIWWFMQFPLIFMWQEFFIYWNHRMHHTPFFYKHFHKLHHRYKHPTIFSATAVHPVEFIQLEVIILSPIFIVPVHFIPLTVLLLYAYYHALIDHSGINFYSKWWQPWQPDSIYHDNHHQYFHVNFGFNTSLWDKLFGTYRRKDRIYTEDIFYGKGKPLEEATADEKEDDLRERWEENPICYRSHQNEYLVGTGDKEKKNT